jgi:hypothetical protein
MSTLNPPQKRGVLQLYCYKCTREGLVPFMNSPEECDAAATEAGWVVDGDRMICPSCPASRSHR